MMMFRGSGGRGSRGPPPQPTTNSPISTSNNTQHHGSGGGFVGHPRSSLSYSASTNTNTAGGRIFSKKNLCFIRRFILNVVPIPLIVAAGGGLSLYTYYVNYFTTTSNNSFVVVEDTINTVATAKSKSKTKTKNYVFGYGSLICPQSRKITNPNLGSAIPVIVNDLERVWSARIITSGDSGGGGWTAMGVNFKTGARCSGVLIEVSTKEEFIDLDKREANYNRKLIDIKNINKIPYLIYDDYNNNSPLPIFQDTQQQNTIDEKFNDDDDDDVKVWVYVQQDPIFANPSYPIPQSYIDIIMRGCLNVGGGTKFAKSFIETTVGWDCGVSYGYGGATTTTTATTNDQQKYYYCWIDDRTNPWYVRADPEFSNTNKHMIDNILKESIPNEFENRVVIP